ncbi:MAG: MBL fold metallo-hydrolase [Clostridia bacterium]|nr:MBL fold metallo-hydrolase [Clostridia bacterium]
MKIYTLGTAAGTPLIRSNACTVLETAEQFYMIDAGGPAASLMFRRNLDPGKLRAVFISHLHRETSPGALR